MKKIAAVFFLLFIYTILQANTPPHPYYNSHYFEINSINIHYRVWLPENKKFTDKVLLVHGFCSSTYSWRNNIGELLQNNCMVVAVDLPPFGYSDKNTEFNYSFTEMSQMLWELLCKVDADYNDENSWTLVGHSIGAGIVALMAKENNERTKSLIIIDGLVGHHISAGVKLLLKNSVVNLCLQFAANHFLLKQSYVQNVLESAYGRAPSRNETSCYLQPMMERNFANAVIRFSRNFDGDFDLQHITVPVLLIWGENDRWITVAEAEKLKNSFSNSELVIVNGAYHCPMETHPDFFNSLLTGFIKEKSSVSPIVRK